MWKYIVVVLFHRLEKDGGRLLLKKFEIGKSAAGGGGGGGYGRGRRGEERFFVPFLLLLLLSLHLSWKRRRRREKFKKSLRRRRSDDGLPLFSFWKVKQGCQVGRKFLAIYLELYQEHFLLEALSRPSAAFCCNNFNSTQIQYTISQII